MDIPLGHLDPKPLPELLRLPAFADLAEYVQWVGWQYLSQPRGKKAKKPPLDPHTGQGASIYRPEQWGTLAQASAGLDRFDFAGIGFVLTSDDPFLAVDLDRCRDLLTGALTPFVQEVVRAADTYTEISPSGRGVRCLLKGTLPAERIPQRRGFEWFDRAHIATLTGHHLPGTPTAIAEDGGRVTAIAAACRASAGAAAASPPPAGRVRRRPQLGLPQPAAPVALSDDEVLQHLQMDKDHERYWALWRGEWQGLYESHSHADIALAGRLAFYCAGDVNQMDRLFRRSSLMRRKWDQRGHRADGATYGHLILETAADNRYGSYSGRGQGFTIPPPPPENLPEGHPDCRRCAALETALEQAQEREDALLAALTNTSLNANQRLLAVLLSYGVIRTRQAGWAREEDGAVRVPQDDLRALTGLSERVGGMMDTLVKLGLFVKAEGARGPRTDAPWLTTPLDTIEDLLRLAATLRPANGRGGPPDAGT